ncbi:MAG: OmpA family protein [Hyphomicrobiaceae bacterium]
MKRQRVESVSKSGARIIQEPGNRTIVRQNNRAIITRNEAVSINRFVPNAKTTRRNGGITETVYTRPGGVRVYSEVDSNGRLLRRYRRDGSGRIVTFVDNRRFYRRLAVGAGVGALAAAAIIALSPPVHALPRDKYIVDYVNASDEDIYETLTAPPVERLERTYSLDEIRYSPSLLARMRRIDLDNINFETGSFDVTPDQYDKLARIARAIRRAIEHDPTEVFLIEGHTDAVGSTEDNLSLSDRRAESVAQILVEHFDIPIENLVTQGYGEQYLKIDTQGPERANRRVALRRITPLLSRNGGPN